MKAPAAERILRGAASSATLVINALGRESRPCGSGRNVTWWLALPSPNEIVSGKNLEAKAWPLKVQVRRHSKEVGAWHDIEVAAWSAEQAAVVAWLLIAVDEWRRGLRSWPTGADVPSSTEVLR